MQRRAFYALLFTILASTAFACGPGRTAAATQPSPAAFDPSTSDEKALAIVDSVMQKIGGADAFEAVKQVRWEHKYMMDGELKNHLRHAWDKWNGRHNFQMLDMVTYAEAQAEGDPGRMKWSEVMYNLFDRSKGYGMYGGREVGSEDRDRIIETGYDRWQHDSYQLTMLFKLRDPGVKVTYFGEVKEIDGTLCKPVCDTLKLEFAPEVGTDTYYINVNRDSGMPEVIEKQLDGPNRIGYHLTEWTEVNGLKFATRYQNVGLKGEVFEVSNIQLGDPDDRLYVPQVR